MRLYKYLPDGASREIFFMGRYYFLFFLFKYGGESSVAG
jgi:hypothetical protein